jgi:hypothetical protein
MNHALRLVAGVVAAMFFGSVGAAYAQCPRESRADWKIPGSGTVLIYVGSVEKRYRVCGHGLFNTPRLFLIVDGTEIPLPNTSTGFNCLDVGGRRIEVSVRGPGADGSYCAL